jgi:hypothetical protein
MALQVSGKSGTKRMAPWTLQNRMNSLLLFSSDGCSSEGSRFPESFGIELFLESKELSFAY